LLEDQELAFLGKITAWLTHDLKNVLAIILENAGLMEDILSFSPKGALPHPEKFFKPLTVIQNQVRRGAEISTALNRLGKSLTEPPGEVEVNALLQQTAFLLERPVRLKRGKLEVIPAEKGLAIKAHPLPLYLALGTLMEILLEDLAPGGAITLRPEQNGADIALQVAAPAADETRRAALPPQLAGLKEMLGLRLDSLNLPGQKGFLLTVPRGALRESSGEPESALSTSKLD
jgi:hypothetical protein